MGGSSGLAVESFELLRDGQPAEGSHMIGWLTLRAADDIASPRELGFSGQLDVRFAKTMVKTASLLVAEGYGPYAFSAYDEIAILLRREGVTVRELLVQLATVASVELTLLLGRPAGFDARLFKFPGEEESTKFFGWRQTETHSRATSLYCREVLDRKGGSSARLLDGLAVGERVELLSQNGFDLGSRPRWEWGGTGVYLATASNNPEGLVVDTHLPQGDAYKTFLRAFLP